ncbi:MAG: GntR family transcriptional regulator [Pseudomonadota bacterium]
MATGESGTTRAKGLSQTQRAVQELRHLILTNRLPAGSNHLESELAEQLGMSRTPVREATLVLETQGLLKVRPRRGVQISSLSAKDMEEIYQVLTELESLAAELVARRAFGEERFAPLVAAMEDMEAAITAEDREAWARADERFHAELVSLAGNGRIIAIVSAFNDQVSRARALTLYIRPLPEDSLRDHRALLDALRSGDAAAARDIHRTHRIKAQHMMVDLLRKHGFHSV